MNTPITPAAGRFRSAGLNRRRRGGISLLEVLISVFVLSMGLLGVAAMIPLGKIAILKAAIADRSASCGVAGLHEARVRGMLNPNMWVDVLESGATPQAIVQNGWLDARQSFAIDPLFVAANPADLSNLPTLPPLLGGGPDNLCLERIKRFPFAPGDYSPSARFPQMYIPEVTMRRVTLNHITYPTGSVIGDWLENQRIVSTGIFTWSDDVVFPVPDDEAERPRQMMLCRNGGVSFSAEFPTRAHELPATPQSADYNGNFSWMITVTPAARAPDDGSYDPTGGASGNDPLTGGPTYPHPASFAASYGAYTVSVIVFHKRDLTPPWAPGEIEKPGERTCTANFIGGGYGGGDVLLTVPGLGQTAPIDRAEFLDVRKGQWLMMMGTQIDTALPPANPGFVPPVGRYVFKWYRVVSVGDIEENPPHYQRFVTLAGPDWYMQDPVPGQHVSWCMRDPNPVAVNGQPYFPHIDVDGNGTFADAQAALFTGVVGVYTTTVEVN